MTTKETAHECIQNGVTNGIKKENIPTESSSSPTVEPQPPSLASATPTEATTQSDAPNPPGFRRPHHDHQPVPELLEPFRYVTSNPGKGIRGLMLDCFQTWFQVPEAHIVQTVKEIVDQLHNASLLIDDIEDGSTLRRGLPVAHLIFGIPNVINTANYVYFLALARCHDQLRHPAALQVFVHELLNLHRGQGHEILWRDSFTCPTEEQYLDMVRDKTGGLFRLAIGLLQPFSTQNCHTNFDNLINNISIYFQIRDDLLNLVDDEFHLTKTVCEDLTEGKFGFSIIHGIRSDPNDTRLISILKQRPTDVDVKRFAVRLLLEAGSLLYARDRCFTTRDAILQEIEELGGNNGLVRLIRGLDEKLLELDEATLRKRILPNSSGRPS